MACSFCCAPLLAAREVCATATRCRHDPDLTLASIFEGRFLPDRCLANLNVQVSPTALGGYRAGGSQVREMPAKWGSNAQCDLRQTGPRDTPAALVLARNRQRRARYAE